MSWLQRLVAAITRAAARWLARSSGARPWMMVSLRNSTTLWVS